MSLPFSCVIKDTLFLFLPVNGKLAGKQDACPCLYDCLLSTYVRGLTKRTTCSLKKSQSKRVQLESWQNSTVGLASESVLPE
jgi:hypothetical protein